MTTLELFRTTGPDNVRTKNHAPGNIAVWIFIYAELTEFAFFFLAFLVAKLYFPEDFRQGPLQLNTLAGFLNTLALLTSSFFIARAVQAIKRGAQRQTVIWLLCTVGAGVTYCLIKAWEYQWNEARGITARTSYFFATYYYLMFNHFLHVVIGTFTILGTTVRAALGHFTADSHEGLEGAASYWHMIDLVWILIFPLLYILR